MMWSLLLVLQTMLTPWTPNYEFHIPSNSGASGLSWTRVTPTLYDDVGGWAFTFKTGQRIRARLFDDVLVGTEPNAKPSGYTGDLTLDTTDVGKDHYEPDICWNPTTRNIILAWNNRLSQPGDAMDVRYRVIDEDGVAQMSQDALGTHKKLTSQWRPLIEPYGDQWIMSFTGNDKDSAFFTVIDAATPFDLSTDYPAQATDIKMAPVIGTHRQIDQHAIGLPDGRILCAWNHFEGKGRVRYRLFNADCTPTSNYVELPAQLTYGKDEPRLAYSNGYIWLVYHHEVKGGEYYGLDVYATVLSYNSTSGAISVVKDEFAIHPIDRPGLQLKPEIIIANNKVIIVFEDYPSAYVPTGYGAAPYPVMVVSGGYSQICYRIFSLGGGARTRVLRLDNQSVSNPSGTVPYALRPDIALSADGEQAMVCWTQTNLIQTPIGSRPNDIYSIQNGTPTRLYARVIDLTTIP